MAAKKSSASRAGGVNMVITAASLALTIGGWGALTAQEAQGAPASEELAPLTLVVEAPARLELAPLPTIVPFPVELLERRSAPRAVAAPPSQRQPAARQPAARQLAARQPAAPRAAAPQPAARTRSSR